MGRIFPEIARIAYPDRQSLPPINHSGEIFSANRGFDDILHFAHIDAVASGSLAVGFDFKIGSPCDPLCIQVYRTRNLMQNSFDLFCLLFDGGEIAPKNLYPNLSADSSREHIDSVTNRLSPDVAHSRHPQLFIKALQDRLLGCSRRPLILGLEHDDGFGHVHGCGINRAFGSPNLSDHALHERVLRDDPILPAQNLACLCK